MAEIPRPKEDIQELPGQNKSERPIIIGSSGEIRDSDFEKARENPMQPPKQEHKTEGGIVLPSRIEHLDKDEPKEKGSSSIFIEERFPISEEDRKARDAEIRKITERRELTEIARKQIGQEIQEEVAVIDRKIKQLEEAGKLDSTGLVPKNIIEARKIEIEKLIEKRERILRGEELISQEKDEQKEKIKSELIGLAKEMAEKKQTTDELIYKRAREVYRGVTGQELDPKVRERAAEEAEAMKMKIISKQEFLERENEPVRLRRRIENIRKRENDLLIQQLWLQQKESARIFGTKVYESPEQMKAVLAAKKAELEKIGISMSEGALYELLNQGYRIDEIKIKRSWFGFGKPKSVNLPVLPMFEGKKETRSIKLSVFAELIKKTEENNNKKDNQYAQFEIENILRIGQRRLRGLENKCTRDIIIETGLAIEKDRQIEIEKDKQIKARQEALLKEKEEAEKRAAKANKKSSTKRSKPRKKK